MSGERGEGRGEVSIFSCLSDLKCTSTFSTYLCMILTRGGEREYPVMGCLGAPTLIVLYEVS